MAQFEPIERFSYVTQRLVTDFPPRWDHPNKSAVHEISSPPGSVQNGELVYTRWAALPLPDQLDILAAANHLTVSSGFYDYVPVSTDPLTAEWHVNFADPILFGFYGSELFAQDEMQVAEHPALGSLPDAIRSSGGNPITNGRNGPTPILVSGVERRAKISTNPNPDEGRPNGLYGNDFSDASIEAIQRATKPITPPTVSNIIAIAAPSMGRGSYSVDQVKNILTIASTGFTAAVSESSKIRHEGANTIVHTGFWGCGAFGGNKVLMTMLQLLASRIAGVEKLIIHTGDSAGASDVNKSVTLIKEKLVPAAGSNVAAMIAVIVSLGFKWGFGDGN